MKSRKGQKRAFWTTEEEDILREFYPKEGPKGLVNRLPRRTRIAINVRACILGCEYKGGTRYTQAEEAFITEHYPSKGWRYLAEHLGRDPSSIMNKIARMRLNRGVTRSTNNKTYKGHNDISGSFWTRIQRSARERGLDLDITIEYIWNLYELQDRKCKLSCLPIRFSSLCQSKDGTASLDRIDSSKGYIKGNVQWVHKDINMMKQDHTDADFIALCKAVATCNT